jgi:transcriptional regulator with XRE-family HTH domain
VRAALRRQLHGRGFTPPPTAEPTALAAAVVGGRRPPEKPATHHADTLSPMSPDPAERWNDLGAFIREQRGTARLSLRRLSELAGISNPYLSQIERGLRRPSAEILQQIAKALRISAETLYVQAGILDPPDGSPDLARQILADPHLSEEQKQALVRIYLSLRRETEGGAGVEAAAAAAPAGADDAPPSGAGVAVAGGDAQLRR